MAENKARALETAGFFDHGGGVWMKPMGLPFLLERATVHMDHQLSDDKIAVHIPVAAFHEAFPPESAVPTGRMLQVVDNLLASIAYAAVMKNAKVRTVTINVDRFDPLVESYKKRLRRELGLQPEGEAASS